MKFIQVFNRYLAPGGEEKSVARIAAHLELGGHQVFRFWRASQEWTAANAPSKLRQALLLWRNGPVLEELRRLHEREKADAWILHNVIPVVSLGVYHLARELNVPIFQWLHNYRPISPSSSLFAGGHRLEPDDPWITLKEVWHGTWNGRLRTAWLAAAYWALKQRGDFASVKAWVAVSEQVRTTFLRAGWNPTEVFTLRHAWDVLPPPQSVRDEGYFLFLGRMVETKGVRMLVELWRRPEMTRYPLIMAGQGPLVDALRPILPPGVRWIGHVEGAEKRRWVQGCRAVLFPNLWAEPLSTVAYEAYQDCKPILASPLGGMPEIVLDGITGRLVDPHQPGRWQEAILDLGANPDAASRLGHTGRAWLEREATADVWRQRFGDIACRVLPQPMDQR